MVYPLRPRSKNNKFLPSKKGIPTYCSYLAVTTRESPLSVNGVKGDAILEDPIESD